MKCLTHEQLVQAADNADQTFTHMSKTTTDDTVLGSLGNRAAEAREDIERHEESCKVCHALSDSTAA